MNKYVTLDGKSYEVIKEYKDGFNEKELQSKWTDYFEEYDYIVGDYAYDKLRLKGFCNPKNVKYNSMNSKDKIEHYIINDCAYECKYFILKKISNV